jgi:hypothetical protein
MRRMSGSILGPCWGACAMRSNVLMRHYEHAPDRSEAVYSSGKLLPYATT